MCNNCKRHYNVNDVRQRCAHVCSWVCSCMLMGVLMYVHGCAHVDVFGYVLMCMSCICYVCIVEQVGGKLSIRNTIWQCCIAYWVIVKLHHPPPSPTIPGGYYSFVLRSDIMWSSLFWVQATQGCLQSLGMEQITTRK